MKTVLEDKFLHILESELVPALGCTEPIAIAYAAAKAAQVLGAFPEKLEICCSGNIIKNVKGVTVPNSGGMKGVAVAAILGVVGGEADRELEVLEGVTDAHREKTAELLKTDFFTCRLQEDVANLYIVATVTAGEHSAAVTIVNKHTYITEIKKDGEILFSRPMNMEKPGEGEDWSLSIKNILDFARDVDIEKVKPMLSRQIELNSAVARSGLEESYGAQVGRTLLSVYGNDASTRARAMAAAGSDARMGGCKLPVVINSGSGNQGLTVSLPVIEYAKEWNASAEQLYRALLISNLTSIHLKHYIGSLSAFCGAVTAACGAGAAITYLAGGSEEQISRTIVTTIANVSGMICDGAKSSCAAKIASALDAAILAHNLSMKGLSFKSGEGIIQEDVESTIRSVGYVGRVGMKTTDVEILHIMMDQVEL